MSQGGGKEKAGSGGAWRRWAKILIGLFLLGAVAYAVSRAPTITREFDTTLRHFSARRLPWLAISVGAEAASFWCYAIVQRSLLLEGGARLTRRTMVKLAVAATGLTNLVPGGTAPASGWLVAQYRKRGIRMPLALWAVLAGGFAATVSVLLLTLTGAAIAGLLGPIGIVLCGAALLGGSVAVVGAAHNFDRVEGWLRTHHFGRFDHRLTQIGKRMGQIGSFRTSHRAGTKILALSVGNWGLDVACLIAAFPFLGLPVPWRAVLFAYALAQVAGSLAPVPGGIGVVEGSMVGGFALAGTPVGAAFLATIVYRLITSVGVAAVGSAMVLYVRGGHADEKAHAVTRRTSTSAR
jgi:putative heme transporter